MKLIVGLGNPGRTYQKTRHNVGFMVLDELAKRLGFTFSFKPKFKGNIASTTINNTAVVLLKPNTYMNLSGEAVLAVKQFYQLDDSDILVIHDDLDLPCGKIRVRQKGGSAGHKGLKSIINMINSENFQRIKIGIDKSIEIPVVDYVLGKFTKQEKKLIDEAIDTSIEIIYDWLTQDILSVMNKYN